MQLATDVTQGHRGKTLARMAFDAMPLAVLLDADGAVLDTSLAALDAAGITLADVAGRPFWSTPWWRGVGGIERTLKDGLRCAMRGEQVVWDTPVATGAAGKETILEASLAPVRNERGDIVVILFEGRNVSKRRALEREIARERNRLETALQETRQQLLQAQKMKGIGHLDDGVAHDFNNLLAIIIGNLETLQSVAEAPELDRPRLARLVGNAVRGAERAAALTQRLLTFARPRGSPCWQPHATNQLKTALDQLKAES